MYEQYSRVIVSDQVQSKWMIDYLIFLNSYQRFFHVHEGQHCWIKNSIDNITVISHNNAVNYDLPYKFPSQNTKRLRIQRVGAYYYFLQQFYQFIRILFVFIKTMRAYHAVNPKQYKTLSWPLCFWHYYLWIGLH